MAKEKTKKKEVLKGTSFEELVNLSVKGNPAPKPKKGDKKKGKQ